MELYKVVGLHKSTNYYVVKSYSELLEALKQTYISDHFTLEITKLSNDINDNLIIRN